MASLHPSNRSPFWWIKTYDPVTKKTVFIKTQHRKEAVNGRRRALQQVFAMNKDGRTGAAWEVWVDDWLVAQFKNPKTVVRYRNAWSAVAMFLKEAGVHDASSVQYKHAQEYLTWRTAMKRHRGTPISRNTAIMELKVLSRIMREAHRRGDCTSNPLYQMGLQRDETKRKRALTTAEIELIRKALKTEPEWMQISFEVAIHQGCRMSETSVPFTDIDFDRKTITFRAKGKNGQPKIFGAPLHPGLVPLLQRIKARGDARTCEIGKLPGKLWWQFFRRKDVNLPDVSFHCTRVTVVTMLARAGVPIQQAKAYVGHASDTIHDIYLRLAPADVSGLAEAVKV